MNLKDKGWEGVNWINIARNNDRKRVTVNAVINVHAENLCDFMRSWWLLKKDCATWNY
jgi:hypothetical protein